MRLRNNKWINAPFNTFYHIRPNSVELVYFKDSTIPQITVALVEYRNNSDYGGSILTIGFETRDIMLNSQPVYDTNEEVFKNISLIRFFRRLVYQNITRIGCGTDMA